MNVACQKQMRTICSRVPLFFLAFRLGFAPKVPPSPELHPRLRTGAHWTPVKNASSTALICATCQVATSQTIFKSTLA